MIGLLISIISSIHSAFETATNIFDNDNILNIDDISRSNYYWDTCCEGY